MQNKGKNGNEMQCLILDWTIDQSSHDDDDDDDGDNDEDDAAVSLYHSLYIIMWTSGEN